MNERETFARSDYEHVPATGDMVHMISDNGSEKPEGRGLEISLPSWYEISLYSTPLREIENGLTAFVNVFPRPRQRKSDSSPPQVGQEYRVVVRFPFYGRIGEALWAEYMTSYEEPDKRYIVKCLLLEGRALCTTEAEIVIRVTEVHGILDILDGSISPIRPVQKRIDDLPFFDSCASIPEIDWFGNGWKSIFWDEGWGDYKHRVFIYTDAEGVDHHIASEYGDLYGDSHICFQNEILGEHAAISRAISEKLLDGGWCSPNDRYRTCMPSDHLGLLLHCQPTVERLWLNANTLERLHCSSNAIIIWDSAFHSECLRELMLPHSVSVGECAFSDCPRLERVIVPDNCSLSIAPNAFDGCSDKLTFSVMEDDSNLINYLGAHGFRVETRRKGAFPGNEIPPAFPVVHELILI